MSKPKLTKINGRKYWYIEYYEDGERKKRSTGAKDFAQAEVELEAFLEEQGFRKPEKNLVPHILDAYIEMRTPEIASPKTLEFRAKPLKQAFRRRLPSMIRREHAISYTEKRKLHGVSNSTINSELTLLRSALRFALEQNWISKVHSFPLPKPNPPKERWLTKSEAHKFLDACCTYHLKIFCILAMNAAARRGAIQDLTWEQVDLEERRINFNPPGRLQTHKRRVVVPINDTLYAALIEARERATSDYVVEYGGRRVKKINKSFRSAARKAGFIDVTPNTLRHTCATWMAQAGVDMWQIAGMLGHTDIKTTMKHYAKHHPDYLKDGAKALNDIWRVELPKQKSNGRRQIKW